jgi:hypothetical protein
MDDVEFIAAERTVLIRPEFSGVGVDNQALRVAMSVGPDFRFRVLFSYERIVGWNAAVVAQAKDFAGVIGKLLGPVLMMAAPTVTNKYSPMKARRPP